MLLVPCGQYCCNLSRPCKCLNQCPRLSHNPYQFYARLRELDEPYFYEDINVYLLSKYPDVDGAARNPKLVRSEDLFLDQDDVKAHQRARNWHDMPNHERFVQSNLLERDGDSHFRLRVIAMRALTKSSWTKYENH